MSAERKSGHLLLPLSISSAFAHTRCISPSVTAFSSFIRRATSLLRGRQGRLPPHATDLVRCEKYHGMFSVNAIPCRRYNPSVSFADSSPYTGEPRFALHLHQCGTREPRRLPPHATELQRCEPRLSPPTAGCPHPSRRSAKAQHRATFPKGKARATAAAERRYCRCAYRHSSAVGGAKAVFPKGKGFSPHKFAVFVAPGRVFCYNTYNNTQNAQKGLFV